MAKDKTKPEAEPPDAPDAPDSQADEREMYAIIPKRLVKIVAAALKEGDSLPTEQLSLRRNKGRLSLAATDGRVLVVADAPADKTLFESGHEVVLPRCLVNALVKTRTKADDSVEIADAGQSVQAHLGNGMVIEARQYAAGVFPDYESIVKPRRSDCVIELSADRLKTVLKAILSACPDASRLTFHVSEGSSTMRITAQDEEADILLTAIIAGAETMLPKLDLAPPPAGDEAAK